MYVAAALLALFVSAPHQVHVDDTPLSHEQHPAEASAADALGPSHYVAVVGAGLASAAVTVGSVLGGAWLWGEHPDLWAPIALASLALPVLATAPITAVAIATFDPDAAPLLGLAAPFAAAAGGAVLGGVLWWPGFLISGVGVPLLSAALIPVIGFDTALMLITGGFLFSYVAGPVAGLLLSTTLTPVALTVRMAEDIE